MVRAWYMDSSDEDQRFEHQRDPASFLSLEHLYESTGVEYYHISIQNLETDPVLKDLRTKRGYTYEDEITCSKECLKNYEESLKNFYTEHLHTDEEIRLVLDGSGYFDVRDHSENWIRVEVVPGDLIIIPSGIYHRFTLDIKNYIKAKRYFVGEPMWTPYNRPADNMECRKQYVNKLQNKSFIIH